jgi:hypothetical protein
VYEWFADRLQQGHVLRVNNQGEQKQNSVPVMAYDSILEKYRCGSETCECIEQRTTQERKLCIRGLQSDGSDHTSSKRAQAALRS